MGNISRKSKKKLIQKMKATYGYAFYAHDLYSHSGSWRKIPKEDDES